jgi:hypothetical protein
MITPDTPRRSYIWMKVKFKLHFNSRHIEKTLLVDQEVQNTYYHRKTRYTF